MYNPILFGFLLPGILLLSACSGSDTPGCDPDPGPSRGLSESCCPDYGVDACGAGLFCAALDGRSIPTCYAEGSRQDLESCSDDRHCSSGSCNAEAGKCRTTSVAGGEKCSNEVGCVVAATGEALECKQSVCGGDPCIGSCEAAKLCPDATLEQKNADCAAECQKMSADAKAAGCSSQLDAYMACYATTDVCAEDSTCSTLLGAYVSCLL